MPGLIVHIVAKPPEVAGFSDRSGESCAVFVTSGGNLASLEGRD
jgi:hypothetical protein